MGRPLLTALREFIIVVLCVILLIMRANSLFFMMKFIRICDVILRYLTLEGVLLVLLVCFLSLLLHLAAEVEPHLHLVPRTHDNIALCRMNGASSVPAAVLYCT